MSVHRTRFDEWETLYQNMETLLGMAGGLIAATFPIIIFSKQDSIQDIFETREIAHLLHNRSLIFEVITIEKARDFAIIEFVADLVLLQLGKSPVLFIEGRWIGGLKEVKRAFVTNLIDEYVCNVFEEYEYDLIVVGGGKTGRALALEAAKCNKNVALCDFPSETPWGPIDYTRKICGNLWKSPYIKNIYNKAKLFSSSTVNYCDDLTDIQKYSWLRFLKYIKKIIEKELSVNYKDITKYGVTVYNARMRFESSHSLVFVQANNSKLITEKRNITGINIAIAVGANPVYELFPGATTYCLPIDQFFSVSFNPKNTLFIGHSCNVLVCGCILQSLGMQCTIMMATKLPIIPGFDQEITRRIMNSVQMQGVIIMTECRPIRITRVNKGPLPILQITVKKSIKLQYNTVFLDHSCIPNTSDLGLDFVNVLTDLTTQKVIANEYDETTNKLIFAVGCVNSKCTKSSTNISLTAARLLAARLFDESETTMDYTSPPVAIYTPIECAMAGLGEQHATHVFSMVKSFYCAWKTMDDFFVQFKLSLERSGHSSSQMPHHIKTFIKLTCVHEDLRVIGVQILGPLAIEVIQCFGYAIKGTVTLKQFEYLLYSFASSPRIRMHLMVKCTLPDSRNYDSSSDESGDEITLTAEMDDSLIPAYFFASTGNS